MTLLQDLRAAWRFLWKRPGSTSIAVVTLAVAVAIAGLAAGLADQAFLRPAGHGDLITVYNTRAAAPQFQVLSYPDYLAVRERLDGSASLAAFVRVESTLTSDDGPMAALTEIVSGNYFDVLGARPQIGRLLDDTDARGAAGNVVVISNELWHRRFGARSDALGRDLRLGRERYTIVGVAAPDTRDPAYEADAWLSTAAARQVFQGDYLSRRDIPIFQTIGRRQGGVSLGGVAARIESLDTAGSADGWRLAALPGEHLRFWPAYRDAIARFLAVFMAIAIGILLIAAANLAGLLLARGGERARELAVRQALGASPARLLWRVASEGLILTTLGTALGLALAAAGSLVLTRVPLPVPAPLGVTFDVRLAAWCATVAFAAATIFTGLSTGWRPGAGTLSVFGAASRTVSARTPATRALVVVQIALCSALLAGAGLLTRTARNISAIDVGFDTSRQALGLVTLRDQPYDEAAARRFYDTLQDALRHHPQVESVALGWHAPLTRMRVTGTYSVDGGGAFQARQNVVSDGYFSTLGIDLLQGRDFDSHDKSDGEPVAIVNETFAAKAGGESVIGRVLRERPGDAGRRIIGVAREIKYNGVTEGAQPFVYLPFSQVFRPDMYVHLRTRDAGAAALLRADVSRLNPDVLVTDAGPYAAVAATAVAVPRRSALVASAGGALAMLLALVGLYGVLAASVERRRRELAIRAALGATPTTIVTGVMREALVMTVAGLALGSVLSVWSGRVVADLLFGVNRHDPVVLMLVPVLVTLASALAWVVPARRASAVDPAAVLRAE